MSKAFWIVDAHSEIYRAYYAPFRNLTSPDGVPTKAVYQFTKYLLDLVQTMSPRYVAICFDPKRETLLRKQIYPEYKAQRSTTPSDIVVQVKWCKRIVEAAGFMSLCVQGYESDDAIATLVRQHSVDVPVVIVGKDHDLHQHLGASVRMWGGTGYVQSADVSPPPHLVVDFKALAGCSGDNIPGAKGVGKKTALDLLHKYGSLRNVYANLEQLKPKLAERLQASKEDVWVSRKLAKPMFIEALEPSTLSAYQYRGVNWRAVRPLFRELGFSSLLR